MAYCLVGYWLTIMVVGKLETLFPISNPESSNNPARFALAGAFHISVLRLVDDPYNNQTRKYNDSKIKKEPQIHLRSGPIHFPIILIIL